MRKGLGLLFAISLCLPVGVMAASPAGAVNTVLPKCKLITGTQTFKPALPPLSSSTLVLPTTTTILKITGCVGGGITSGKSNSVTKATSKTNCKTLFNNAGKPAKPTTGKITWSNGQTSTTSNVLTVTSATATTIKAKLVSKYTAGLGKGKQSTVLFTATPNAGWCFKVAFSKTTFKSTKITSP
jgi:hypothetical protein